MGDKMTTTRKRNFLDIPTAGMMFVILIVLSVVLNIANPSFFSQYNVTTLLRTISYTTIVGFGQTLILLTGGIDLSVAGMAGMSGIISSWLMVNAGWNPFLCIILLVVFAFVCGCLNGVLITKMGMQPFIVTLATGSIFTGVIYVITEGSPITGLPEEVTSIGRGILGIVPYPTIVMIILCVVLFWVLKYTPYGRSIYAVGGNAHAARIAGINTDRVTISLYGICAVTSSIAGMLLTFRLGTAQPSVAADWVMPSVTAACIGGTSLAGGKGGVIGTIVGGALMGVISNAIVLLAVSTYWEQVITGIVILIAISIDRIKAIKNNEV